MYTLKTYKNGLRLIHNFDNANQAVTVSFVTLVGGKDEDDSNRGIAHLAEHMFFKGTTNRTNKQLTSELDTLGILYNASTSKDLTTFYTMGLAEQCEKMVDVLADCFFNSNYPENELKLEKDVVCSELCMYLDDNKEQIFTKAEDLGLQGTEYAYTLGGTVESVSKIERADLLSFKERFYKPERLIISISGNIELEEVEQLIDKYVLPNCSTDEVKPVDYATNDFAIDLKERISFTKKDTEQFYSVISFRYINRTKEDMCKFLCMLQALGGPTGSRLYKQVREEKGLVYSISTLYSEYVKSMTGIMFYSNRDKAEATYKAIREVLEDIRERGFKEEDLQIAKNSRKTSLVLSTINPANRAIGCADRLIYKGELLNVDKQLKAIEEVTLQDINDMFNKYFDNNYLAVAYLAKDDNIDPIKILKD